LHNDGEILAAILSNILDRLPGQWWKPFSLAGSFLMCILFQITGESGQMGIIMGFFFGLIFGAILDVLMKD